MNRRLSKSLLVIVLCFVISLSMTGGVAARGEAIEEKGSAGASATVSAGESEEVAESVSKSPYSGLRTDLECVLSIRNPQNRKNNSPFSEKGFLIFRKRHYLSRQKPPAGPPGL